MEPQQQIFLPIFLPLGMPAATSASPNVKATQQGESAMQQLHERWVTPSYVEGAARECSGAHPNLPGSLAARAAVAASVAAGLGTAALVAARAPLRAA